jgi:GNAT superfamily N-acetyltransferase
MAAPLTRAEIAAIERAAVYAWPAHEMADIEGWLFRYSGGGSKRANATSALAFTGRDVERTIDRIERLYAERGAPAQFQVPGALTSPPDLDDRLAARGYHIDDPVTTMAMRLGATVALTKDVAVRAQADAAWLAVYVPNLSEDRRAAAPGIVAGVPQPRAFFSVVRDGATIATGLGVVHAGAVVCECIGTRPDQRRSGAAVAIMRAIETWGAGQGAAVSGLQVVTANTPAVRLYEKLGYIAVNGYHYRRKLLASV